MLNNISKPCDMCTHGYDADSMACKKCEYNISITLLKHILRYDEHCSMCMNVKRLGGGYYECNIDAEDRCKHGENLIINWEAVCKEYELECIL